MVPLDTWWTGGKLYQGLVQSAASVLVCDAERWERVRTHAGKLPHLRLVIVARQEDEPAAPAVALEVLVGSPASYAGLPAADLPELEIAPDDNTTVFYTSGTIGVPKGALGTHRNILACIFQRLHHRSLGPPRVTRVH